MDKFLIRARYSSASWARMINSPDDRAGVAATLMESLGGSLDVLYYDVESAAAYALVDLPDTVTVAAVVTAIARTGAFTSLEVHELLTQEQLSDALMLARDAAKIYKVPGYAAVSLSADGG